MASRTKPSYAKELTPDWANCRWKKVYSGRQLYFAFPINRDGYRRALEEWLIKKVEIDRAAERDKPHREEYEAAITLRESIAEYCLRELQADPHFAVNDLQTEQFTNELKIMHDRMLAEIGQLQKDFSRIRPAKLDDDGTLPVFPLKGLPVAEILRWQSRLETLRNFRRWNGQSVQVGESINDHVERYLRGREQEVAAGQLRATSLRRLRQRIKVFGMFAGDECAADLSAQTLSKFRDHLLQKVERGEYSITNAKFTLNNVKTFISWLWEEEVLSQLPRNFRRLGIKAMDNEIEVFSITEVCLLVDVASERSKLFILLMLNCGFTQIDISDLDHASVDWTRGRITWKRSKEKSEKNVPTVDYVLWDETFRLLRKHRSRDRQRVLVNENGRPFRRTGDSEDIDNIRLALGRTFRRKDVKGKVRQRKPKLFRKTSASLLETHDIYGRYAQYFLGHSPQTVAQKHYIKPSQEQFDKAISWLGEQFGFTVERVKP